MFGLQAQLLTSAAMRAGFSGGLVVDFPNSTRAKKYFLVLMVGSTSMLPSAKGLDEASEDEAEEIQVESRQSRNKRRKTGFIESVSHPLLSFDSHYGFHDLPILFLECCGSIRQADAPLLVKIKFSSHYVG